MEGFFDIKSGKRLCGMVKLLLAALSLLFYDNIYLPQRAELAKKQAQCLKQEQELEALGSFMKEHPDLNAYERERQEKADAIRGKLPTAMDFNEFVGSLQALAGRYGVRIKGIKPAKPMPQGKFFSQSLRVELNSDYKSLRKFLAAMEKEERFFSITQAAIKADGNGKLTCGLEMTIYALAEE